MMALLHIEVQRTTNFNTSSNIRKYLTPKFSYYQLQQTKDIPYDFSKYGNKINIKNSFQNILSDESESLFWEYIVQQKDKLNQKENNSNN
jgi:hypothetical protein